MAGQRSTAQRHLVPHFTKGAAWKLPDLAILDCGEGTGYFYASPPLRADTRVLDDLLTRLDQVLNMTDDWLGVKR